jgi:citrate lyase beta subunit
MQRPAEETPFGKFRMRSKLFVPAIQPTLFEKALRSEADAVCFDLEDAVAPARKDEARDHLRAFLSSAHAGPLPRVLVRTNPIASTDFIPDLDSAVWNSCCAVALPKVESADDVRAAVEQLIKLELTRGILHPLGLLPTIESPLGLRLAREIALASPRVIGLQVGFGDLLEPLGVDISNLAARNQIRLMLRLAAAEAGLDCFDSAFPKFKDLAGLEAELNASRALGFAGASCIHPLQVPVVNRVFSPTREQIAHSQSIVDAADDAIRRGSAVTAVDGAMVDAPYIERARAILAQVKLLG